MSAFNLAFMNQLSYLPISGSHSYIDMLGDLCSGMLYHGNSVLQYLAVFITLPRKRYVITSCIHLVNQYYPP